MRNLLLYLPFESDFYKGLYVQMKKIFERAGCCVEGKEIYGRLANTGIPQKHIVSWNVFD